MIEFIDEYSKGPNVGFRSVYIMYESLWTHIERTTNSDVFEGVFGLDGKSKISQFEGIALDEDIGHFNIPVYDS